MKSTLLGLSESVKSTVFIAASIALLAGIILLPVPVNADSVIATIPVGSNPTGIAFDSANGDLYVANTGSNTISVINGTTNTVIATIRVNNPSQVAFDSLNDNIYVTNGTNTVSVISGLTNTVIATIRVGTGPIGIVFDPANGDLYTANEDPSSNSVSVINGIINTVITTIPLSIVFPYSITFDSVNGNIYVGHLGSVGGVSEINGTTNTFVTSSEFYNTSNIYSIVFDSGNKFLYVSNFWSLCGCVSEINATTDTHVVDINLSGVDSKGLAFDSANGRIYVDEFGTNSVSVLNGANNAQVGSIAVGNGPTGVAFDSANGNIYVTNSGTGPNVPNNNPNTVSVISTTADDTDPASLGSITAPTSPVPVNTQITASDSFTDDSDDTHTATWNWGDGNTSTGTVTESGGSGSVQNTHTYTTPGIYTLTLTVNNSDGATSSTQFKYVVVFDPSGGFVTGGGWIISPSGAYPANPAATGKANFGFNVRYPGGSSTVPTGNTDFSFSAGNIDFSSTGYNWLVVSSSTQAKFQGTGTINGAGNYLFNIAIQSGSTNFIRIQIINNANNNVVYDTQTGAPLTASPNTPLGGGSFIIHPS